MSASTAAGPLPYNVLELLDEPTTAAVLATPADPPVSLPEDGVRERNLTSVSGVVVVPRAGWVAVHGQDERFLGWGYEDIAFQHALDTIVADVRTHLTATHG